MRKSLLIVIVLALPQVARAGGFEIYEQSPAGVGTAGAQTAETDDPGAVFYNPARMTYLRGLTMLGAVNVIHAVTKVTPPAGGGDKAESTLDTAAPTLYSVTRIGSRFALGLGGWSNMGEVFDWSGGNKFGGRFLGSQINLMTLTLNGSLAFRPLPWLAFGFGLDIVPSTFELHQALNFGDAEGSVHASGKTTGLGGNLGLYVRVVPRWLDFAFTYRSSIDLDFTGHAALNVPPELASMASSYQNAKTSITLPHNFTFALGSHLLKNFSVDVDVHLTLWDSLKSLTLTLTDPKAPAGTPPTSQGAALDFHISYDVRLGFEYRALKEKLRVRVGGGYVRSPSPLHATSPLNPDSDRGLFGFGLGYHGETVGVDASYMLAILIDRTSSNPVYPATYSTMGHVFSIGLTLRFEDFGMRINEPDFKR